MARPPILVDQKLATVYWIQGLFPTAIEGCDSKVCLGFRHPGFSGRKRVACGSGKVSDEGDPIDARSLVAQGRCHIDSNGPIGRRPGGDDADQHEQDRNQAKDEGICGLDPIEKAA